MILRVNFRLKSDAQHIAKEDREVWDELAKSVTSKEFMSGLVILSAWRCREGIAEWTAPSGHVVKFFDFMIGLVRDADAGTTCISSAVQGALYQHWRDNYVGPGVSTLKEMLTNYEADWDPDSSGQNAFSKTLAIIQSSGMGKSRLTDELGKEWFQFPFVFRFKGESGYPSCDHEIFKFLQNSTRFPGASARTLAFFAAIGRIGEIYLFSCSIVEVVIDCLQN